MLTYQDYEKIKSEPKERVKFVQQAIFEHKNSKDYETARIADEYDAQRNTTIVNMSRTILGGNGQQIIDNLSSNYKLTSNFFARLNIQRNTYSLGNGLTFKDPGIMKKLGPNADNVIKDAGYYSLIHGRSFLFWAYDHLRFFKLTEFMPLYNERDSSLGAGVRFYQIAPDKPLYATLYTPEGYIEYESKNGGSADLAPVTDSFKPYRAKIARTPATGDVITPDNYPALPVVPLYGSRLKQSTLVGMRSKIDCYDIVLSGFANDMTDCAQIYWLVSGAGGSSEKELQNFRNRLLFRHIAKYDGDNVDVKAYTQEIPFEARNALLEHIKSQIYEDFGGLDVHTISAGSTNDHIDAAYQPMDENADDFEYQIIDAMQKLLSLLNVSREDATPQFKRNRISNQKEQVEMIALEAEYLDDETILNKLPNVSSEEVAEILKRRDADEVASIKPVARNESGMITESQVVSILVRALGVTREEALKIIRGEE